MKLLKSSAIDTDFLLRMIFVHEILSLTLVLGSLCCWVGAEVYLEPS